ncbi:ovomucoid-like [Palaemon carinicauda]|uniref:ovomucoid-like n=1 Tax=Palaemon carinicauda TaxID=392227 RepID=UPI0035B57948
MELTPAAFCILLLSVFDLEIASARYLGSFQNKDCFQPCLGGKFEPVCGSDGRTYDNACFLNQSACEDPYLKLEHTGFCKRAICIKLEQRQNPSTVFRRLHQTRSGLQRFFHLRFNRDTSGDEMRLASVLINVTLLVMVGTASGGRLFWNDESDTECPMVCTKELMPVCASDGSTYGNDCAFDIAKCRDPSLFKLHAGPCSRGPENRLCRPNPNCSERNNQVCGSDGKIYDSPCQLFYQACFQPDLTMIQFPPCGAIVDSLYYEAFDNPME